MKKIHFWKVVSIGNHFPLVLQDEVSELNLHHLSQVMSEEHFGIGGDGILVLGTAPNGLTLRMFNPDGSEDFCGNGLRCAAHFAFRQGMVGTHFFIKHLVKEVETWIRDGEVVTDIGKASYLPSEIPVDFETDADNSYHRNDLVPGAQFIGSALSTGSTHVVMAPGMPSEEDFQRISPMIEMDARFPNRTSVIWREQIGKSSIRIRIWERGVGETLGCGTGSSAAAIEWMREQEESRPLRLLESNGKVEKNVVEVHNKGGIVKVIAANWKAPIQMSGTASVLYEGDFLYDPLRIVKI